MRRYWITTHWPPQSRDGWKPQGVYLAAGREKAGKDLRKGDRVLIYEAKGGRRIVREDPITGAKVKVPRVRGSEGVIAIVEAEAPVDVNPTAAPELYEDGTTIFWRWYAPTEIISTSGLVPRKRLSVFLGYEPGHAYRAFGTLGSGLKQIDEHTYCAIVAEFMKNCPAAQRPRTNKTTQARPRTARGGTGEGPEHRALKLAVSQDPAAVLGEKGLVGIEVEYEFVTGDRADIILRDAEGRYVAVEVEVDVPSGDICGALQAVKYRHMYAMVCNRRYEEVRAFLVANMIAEDVKDLCRRYGVECFAPASGQSVPSGVA